MNAGFFVRVGIAILLVGSLGLNVALFVRLRQARAPQGAVQPAAAEAARHGVSEETRQAHLVALVSELGGRAAVRAARMQAPASAPSAPDEGRKLLCDMAQGHARACWGFFKEDVLHLLRLFLADPGIQERKTVEKASEIQKILGLGSSEGRDLLAAYAPLRRERVSQVRRLLDEEEVDWGAVFDEVRGLQSEEDALVRRRFGEEKARQLAEALREERLLLLVVLATYAGRPWEDALGR